MLYLENLKLFSCKNYGQKSKKGMQMNISQHEHMLENLNVKAPTFKVESMNVPYFEITFCIMIMFNDVKLFNRLTNNNLES